MVMLCVDINGNNSTLLQAFQQETPKEGSMEISLCTKIPSIVEILDKEQDLVSGIAGRSSFNDILQFKANNMIL